MKPQVVWACLLVIAGVTACSTATEQPFSRVPRRPALSDFASGDRETVSAMLRDVTGKFRSPFTGLDLTLSAASSSPQPVGPQPSPARNML
jgi:hypothetical protein